MTAQVGDKFKYKSNEYEIVAISETLGFHPEDYGIIPEGRNSACWAGFWCEYMISEDGISLEGLFINAKDERYPDINGHGLTKN